MELRDELTSARHGRRTFLLGAAGAAAGLAAGRLLGDAAPAWAAATFRVDAFRAAGDVDDTAAVIRAVQAAERAGGGDVVFGPRTYRLDTLTYSGTGFSWAVPIRGSNIRMVGQGEATVLSSKVVALGRSGPMLLWAHGGGRGCPNLGDLLRAWAPGFALVGMRPAAKGDTWIEATTSKHGVRVGDWLFLRTGQTIPSGTSYQPDAELNQVVGVKGARLQLRWPLAKPYRQEFRLPGATMSSRTGLGLPEPLGFHKVTDALLFNVGFQGLTFDAPNASYWTVAMQTVGARVADIGGRFGSGTAGVQYARDTVVERLRGTQVGIPPLNAQACGGAAGTTKLLVQDVEVTGDRPAMIHLHEGVAQATVRRVRITSPGGGTVDGGISLHGRSYDTLLEDVTIIGGSASTCLIVDETCDAGGTIRRCRLVPTANPYYAGWVRGGGWTVADNSSTLPISVGTGNTSTGNVIRP